MLKLIIIIIALALYGANSLMSSLTSGSDAEKTSAGNTTAARNKTSTASPLVAAAANMAGLSITELPETGCSESVISADNLNELLSYLPENQQQAIGTLLNENSTVWSAQFYVGEEGTGLCIPAKETLVVLPMASDGVAPQLKSVVASLMAKGSTQ